MKIILNHKNMKDKYLVESDSNCYTLSKISTTDNGDIKTNKKERIITSKKTYHGKITDLLNSLFELELRKNECESLREFGKHINKVKKSIKDLELELKNK